MSAWWPEIEAAVKLHLTPDDVVFDIGANVGTYTRLFASICRQVVAFEPNPDLFAWLVGEAFGADVIVRPEALSDKVGKATFYIDTRPEMPAVSSSLMQLVDLTTAGLTRSVPVKTSTIDHFVRETGIVPTFIKIDVEGHEPAVLAGAKKTIQEHRPKIVFELWENHWNRFKRTFRWLREYYYLVRVSDGQDAYTFYSNNQADGGADILALPLRPGERFTDTQEGVPTPLKIAKCLLSWANLARSGGR